MKTENITKHQATPIFEIHENMETGYKSMFAGQNLKAASILATFSGELFATPTRYTVQINENQHIKLDPEYLRYINHSCAPNVFFDTTKRQLISLKLIEKGEELTFFYPSTEWKMTEIFTCSCGSQHCLQHIQGAAYLGYDNLTKYQLTDYVIEKYSHLRTIQKQSF